MYSDRISPTFRRNGVAPYSGSKSNASRHRTSGYTVLAMRTYVRTERPLLRSDFDTNYIVPTNYAVSNFMKIPSAGLILYGERQTEAERDMVKLVTAVLQISVTKAAK